MNPQARDFKFLVLQQFFADIHRLEGGNYDAVRFGCDGVDRSNSFDLGKHMTYLDWFFQHYEDAFRTYMRLADQASRDLFVSLLRYRLAGHLHVRIASRMQRLLEPTIRFKQVFAGVPSRLTTAGMFGNLVHYDVEWEGQRYVVDTIRDALVSTLLHRQYFFERDGLRIAPSPGDVLIDAGSCTGDTTAVFSKAVGPAGAVFAFDPVQAHVEVCRYNFSQPGYENVTVLAAGVSDRTVSAPPIGVTSYSPGWRVDGFAEPVPLARIDDLVLEGSIRRVDFIKLDVEGSELAALRGAIASIRKFRPRLAISIYHKPNDYFELCDFVHELDLGYRFYLDHYTIHDEETVLYAVAG